MLISDIPYARIAEEDILLRRYLPDNHLGHALIMVHGGAWTVNDRLTPYVLNEALAERGLVVASLDFRCGPNSQHPTASSDIAAGIRFVRSKAKEWGIDGQSIGLIGSSSGGHLALYTALKPDEEIHVQTPFLGSARQPVSAEVAYVIALWPVSNPLFRYHHAIDTQRQELIEAHNGYFSTVENMRHASVQRVLDESEFSRIPPALIVQPGEDANVPETMTLDLLRAYQEADGEIDYRHMPKLPHAFAYEASPATTDCEATIWNFVERQLQRFD